MTEEADMFMVKEVPDPATSVIKCTVAAIGAAVQSLIPMEEPGELQLTLFKPVAAVVRQAIHNITIADGEVIRMFKET
jgi:hypothetical protein